ncbi:hypothetical protein LMG19089_00464 [Ralstonia edaphis]|uniref:hypothetical protein n=1 Tax=Ralstonia edaphi TaxID=3058599 RepID=UPI0028F516C1|nr:hypothetical protein [Ralstonia sp. LMG 6871]CAJ0689279.1 hypothetical protein LMG19089_00464 [Ralstonia sp. LMG 6871]
MRLLCLTTVLLVGILSVSACDTKDSRPRELICSGKASLGSHDAVSDRFVLRIAGDSLEIRGAAGTLATFDGTVYKICLNSQSEVYFEYGTLSCSGSKTMRAGKLDKVTGELALERFDLGQSFTGTYNCKSAGRLLE